MIAGLIDLYSLVVVAAVVVSWTNVPRDNPIVQFLRRATEPVLEPIRGAMPEMGGVDLSPIVVLVALRLLASVF